MITKLILKDLRGYWQFIVFWIFLPSIAWSGLLYFPYYPWHGYVLFCSIAIFAAISYFTFSEKKQHLEVLTCSLPVTRTAIVLSRYIFALLVMIAGFIIFYSITWIADLIYSNPVTTFEQINHPKVLLMCLFLISFVTSYFLPAVFSSKIMGMVFNFMIALIFGITVTLKIFRPHQNSYELDFSPEKFMLLIAVTLLLPLISILVSVYSFHRQEF